MNLDDLMLDVEQHVEIKASPEKAFAAVLYRFGEGNSPPDGTPLNFCWRRKRADDGIAIGQRDWTLVGIRPSHQGSSLAGAKWPNVHVVPRQQPCGGKNRTGCRRLQGHAAASRDRHDRSSHRKGVGTGWSHMLTW